MSFVTAPGLKKVILNPPAAQTGAAYTRAITLAVGVPSAPVCCTEHVIARALCRRTGSGKGRLIP